MTISFAEMGLNPQLLVALEQLGFSNATPVQAALVPKALEGGDWIVSSQTGSGKTAAFLLPMLELVFQKKAEQIKQSPTAPWTLVLCPTRELAQQVANDAINLVKGAKGVRIATVTGGASYYVQRKNINGAQLIVATPGRLLDLAQSGAIDLSKVELLTLDEADRMLDFGFSEEIQAIAGKCNNREQTLMFSATFTPRETRLAANLMNQPERITIASATEKHTNITQHLHWVDNSHHQNQLLAHWLKDETLDQAVIFANTQIDAERLATELEKQGYLAAALHGGMPQNVRNRRLDALRKGRTKILVATDVAARGIDVPTITHVFNFGLPMKAEDYVHRIGRTGRAGRNGTAITFAQFSDGRRLREVEFYTKQKFVPKVIEGLEPQNKPEDYARASKPRGGNRNGSGRGYGPSNAGGYRGEQRSYGNGNRNNSSNPRNHSERSHESRPVRDGFPGQTRRADATAPAWARNERPQRRDNHHGSANAERGFYGRKSDGSPSSQRPRNHDGQRNNGGNNRPQRSRSGY